MRPEGHISREEAVKLTGVASKHYFAHLASNEGSGPPFVIIDGQPWYPIDPFLKWMDEYQPAPRKKTPEGYLTAAEIDLFVGKRKGWWLSLRDKPEPKRMGRGNTFYPILPVMKYLDENGILQQMSRGGK
jgi:hypothetical protein